MQSGAQDQQIPHSTEIEGNNVFLQYNDKIKQEQIEIQSSNSNDNSFKEPCKNENYGQNIPQNNQFKPDKQLLIVKSCTDQESLQNNEKARDDQWEQNVKQERHNKIQRDLDKSFGSSSDSAFSSSSNNHSQTEDLSISKHNGEAQSVNNDDFIMKNGCCRDCMKAFSKLGKSCLCQVPKCERRSQLPSNGCKYCGCQGCNPIDIRKNKRQQLKEKLRRDGKYQNKRQRILDSDEEDLELKNQYDGWLKNKNELAQTVSQILSQFAQKSSEYFEPLQLGFGFPMRHSSYILGGARKWIDQLQPKKSPKQLNFDKLITDTIDIVTSKDPKSLDDYDELLSILNDEMGFIQECGSRLEQNIQRDDLIQSKAKDQSIQLIQKAQQRHDIAYEKLDYLEGLMQQSTKTIAISDKLKQLEAQKKSWQDGIRYSQNYQRFNDEKLSSFIEQDFLKDVYQVQNANTLSALNQVINQILLEGNTKAPANADQITHLFQQFLERTNQEFYHALQANDRDKLNQLFLIFSELGQRDQSIQTYLDFVCSQLIRIKSISSTKDKDSFKQYHNQLNQEIVSTFKQEMNASEGRIVEIFGNELWFKTCQELLNNFFKQNYKKFIQEALDTEGKSKQYFLEMLEQVIDDSRQFIAQLKNEVFKENHLDLDAECDQIFVNIFNDYQRLYHKKELTLSDKSIASFYQKSLDKIQQAAQSIEEQKGGPHHVQWFMNKPKLIAIYKELELSRLEEQFRQFGKAIERSTKISLSQQLIINLYDLSVTYLKNFKDKFADKLIEHLEAELPNSENRVEPIYLEIIFRMQLVYQSFQVYLEKVLPHLQVDKSYLHNLEAMMTEMTNDMSSAIQVFNEKIMNNIIKQLQDILTKTQKKNDYNIKKRLSDEIKTTQTSVDVINYVKPFFQVLFNEKYHEKNRMRLLYNLIERIVHIFTLHYQKFAISQEGAILLSGDINKYNELFLQVDADEIIKKYESFKLLINLYLLNPESLQQYIKDHLMTITDKETIAGYLSKRTDYKSSKLDDIINSLF
eukprot:403341127